MSTKILPDAYQGTIEGTKNIVGMFTQSTILTPPKCRNSCKVCCQFWTQYGCSIDNEPFEKQAAPGPRKKLSQRDIDIVVAYLTAEYKNGIRYFGARAMSKEVSFSTMKIAMILRNLSNNPDAEITVQKYNRRLWVVTQ
jgi:hypothetical protein